MIADEQQRPVADAVSAPRDRSHIAAGIDDPQFGAELFGFVRHHGGQRLLVVANFCEHPREMDGNRLRVYGLGYSFTDLISGNSIAAESPLRLDAYQCVWLATK